MLTWSHVRRVVPALLLGLAGLPLTATAQDVPAYGIHLENYEYPFPVEHFEIEGPGETYRMAYMDVKPEVPERDTVVLLHGKNFCGAYWKQTAEDLRDAGYRVVIPDQLGFGKSDMPVDYQYSFAGLASNTEALLESLGVGRATILGHSMGGMLATRFAIMYPDRAEKLVLMNPIGLEDWAAKGVPYRGQHAWYERALALDGAKIRKYQLESYYAGNWRSEYDPWVDLLAGMTLSEDYPQMAKVQALTYDMVYTQPVVQDFPRIQAKTLLIIGQRDRTALGKDLVDADTKKTLGDYPALGRAAAEAIPDATLVELNDVGHLPHIEAYPFFIDPLMKFLKNEVISVHAES